MSEMREESLLFRLAKENTNVSLHRTNKGTNNKFSWTYSNNNLQITLIEMVKICHCYYCTISWYYLQLEWFNEDFILLWSIIWYYFFCDNRTTKTNVTTETNPPTTKTSFDWIKNTRNTHDTNAVHLDASFKLKKRCIRSEYFLVFLIKCKDKKVKKLLLVNDDTKIGKFESLYPYLFYSTHDD